MEDRSSRRMRALVTQMAAGGLSANEIARALISMMARSTKTLQSKAGYIDARPHIPQLEEVLLQRTAGPYIWVIFVRPTRSRRSGDVRFAPIGARSTTFVLGRAVDRRMDSSRSRPPD